jgi:hypothetical protein
LAEGKAVPPFIGGEICVGWAPALAGEPGVIGGCAVVGRTAVEGPTKTTPPAFVAFRCEGTMPFWTGG